MGLSIYYSGRIRHYKEIDNLMEEVSDIADNLGWIYTEISDDKLKGVLVSPEKCEPVVFTFVPDGRLCSPVSITYNQPDDEFYYTIFTKTQFAGPDAHIAVIKLLRYISKKYFAEIKVMDEGKFWETNDERILFEEFARYNKVLNDFTDMLSELQHVPGESAESLADRIEILFKRKNEI